MQANNVPDLTRYVRSIRYLSTADSLIKSFSLACKSAKSPFKIRIKKMIILSLNERIV